jgi:predicted hydrocarbon binding protein
MTLSSFLKKMLMARQLTFEEGRFEMLGIRGANLPVFTLVSILEEVHDEVGDDLFDMLFEAGKEHGEYAIEAIGREHNMSKSEYLRKTTDSANVMGLGELEVVTFNPEDGQLRVKITDSPFVEFFRDSDTLQDIDRPVDTLQRGIVHGVGNELLDGPIESAEEKCAFLGDPHCEIVVRTVEE